MLVCEKAYVKGKKIMCQVSEMPCAHVKFCQLTGKWRQTDMAQNCPGRGKNADACGNTVHGNNTHTVF